jgi:hypothetical protein
MWPEALHITQAVTQSKTPNIAQITQNNTSFRAHFWRFTAYFGAFYGQKMCFQHDSEKLNFV